MKKWTIDDARELYNINGWGTSYFGINDEGNVYVTPCKDQTQIDLREVMDELSLRDVTAPGCCASLISSTTVSRRPGAVSRKLPRNTIIKERTTWCSPSR